MMTYHFPTFLESIVILISGLKKSLIALQLSANLSGHHSFLGVVSY